MFFHELHPYYLYNDSLKKDHYINIMNEETMIEVYLPDKDETKDFENYSKENKERQEVL